MILLGGLLALWYFTKAPEPLSKPSLPCPGPICPLPKNPLPKRPWGPSVKSAVADDVYQAQRGGKTSPDNAVEITCDLPESEKKYNRGGRDGSGLCVFTSIEYSARYQNERKLKDFQAHMTREPGGGYPSKVDAMIKKYGAGTPYLQYEGKDPTILQKALQTNRMPSVTFGPAHMVSLVHLDDKWACITDNNAPKDNQYLWMKPSEFLSQWRANGNGWAVVLLSPPPPPPPFN